MRIWTTWSWFCYLSSLLLLFFSNCYVPFSPGQGPWPPMCQLSDAHSRALSLTITFGLCYNMKSNHEYRMLHWTNATFRTCENPHAAVCVIEQSWHSAILTQIKHPWWFSLWSKFHHNILSYIPILWTLLLFCFIVGPFLKYIPNLIPIFIHT